MEKLVIKNFLTLKEVEFEVGKINIIVGSQATGKSVIAKVLYFFREFLTHTFINSIRNLDNKRDIEKQGLKIFEKYFPKYAWQSQQFRIHYIIESIEITITNTSENTGRRKLKLDYSDSLTKLHRKLKATYKKQRELQDEQSNIGIIEFFNLLDECIYKTDIYGSCFHRPLLIPASRSFFAHLQRNVFSFLSSSIEIDPFISKFGSNYQNAKRMFQRFVLRAERAENPVLEQIQGIIENILTGQYLYEDEEDWIKLKDNKINLSNASSGQQEALPMLIIMAVYPFSTSGKTHNPITFFIEEPEAHLFPSAQKQIISLIALIYSQLNHNFVLTTHSPYILTAINNLILAQDVIDEKGEDKVKSIVDSNFAIKYEDVKAYTIEDGKLLSIMDDENRLIGVNIIDNVSDEFDNEFNALLEMQMEG